MAGMLEVLSGLAGNDENLVLSIYEKNAYHNSCPLFLSCNFGGTSH